MHMRRLHRFYTELTKRRLSLFALLLAVVALFFVINSPAVVGASATARALPVYCVQRDNKCVCLTFDAYSGLGDTRALIGILGKYRVTATFFVTGEWADMYPGAVRALSGAGHEIMNNSDDYAHFSKLTGNQIIQNAAACNDKLAALTGVMPTLFRCPYGDYDDHVVKALESVHMVTVQWDVDSQDWRGLPAAQIVRHVTEAVRPGSIILFHVAAPNASEALPAVIEYLIRNGYAIVPVSQLLLKGNTTVDRTGRQQPA
jgi:peptidoglycan-N-acetylglucosamine deacetylase